MVSHSVTLIMLVTGLTSVLAQDYYEERKLNKKTRGNLLAANNEKKLDGQGRRNPFNLSC